MTPADLSLTVLHAVRRAVDDGALTVGASDLPERVKVERPRPGGHGDYASSIALRLARAAGMPAQRVAEILKERLRQSPGLLAVDITGAGFLNFTLHGSAQQELVREVLLRGDSYGWQEPTGERVEIGAPRDAREAVVAQALGRILISQGVATGTASEPEAPAPDDPLFRRLGSDAARWGVLAGVPLGEDLLRQHEGNPLFRVRYAHSRTRALTRNAAQLGFRGEVVEHVDGPHAHALTAALGDHLAVLASAARLRAPDRVARHLGVVADALLDFQHTVLPLGDEKPSAAHRSRLALAEAAGTVLAGGLSLLGISAPEQI